ncbi:MAG: hypothetical protein ACMXYK_03495 [Candidatus Woesearchaeota archaeon]
MILSLTKGILLFMLGIVFSQFITPLPTLALEQPLALTPPPYIDSPNDWITEDQITILEDRIIIYVDNPRWARFTETNSMNPTFDHNSNALQIVPNVQDLTIGDIITYNYNGISIIHRIVEIGYDELGWYAIVKGDNNPENDPEKVREHQIEKVVIGIIY